jgi:DNA-directed RNA polymerase specialized sigma24 family protein
MEIYTPESTVERKAMSEPGVHKLEAKRWSPAKLLLLLDSDPDRASERYDRVYQKLIRFFAAQFCADPENLAGETIIRACDAISAGLTLTAQLETFLFGVARNVALEDHKRRRRADLPLEELPPRQEPRVDPCDPIQDLPEWKLEVYHDCLQKCLQGLDQEQREQVVLFYEGSEEGESKSIRKQLAIRLGTNTRALNSRMVRVRGKLDSCIRACVERKRSG